MPSSSRPEGSIAHTLVISTRAASPILSSSRPEPHRPYSRHLDRRAASPILSSSRPQPRSGGAERPLYSVIPSCHLTPSSRPEPHRPYSRHLDQSRIAHTLVISTRAASPMLSSSRPEPRSGGVERPLHSVIPSCHLTPSSRPEPHRPYSRHLDQSRIAHALVISTGAAQRRSGETPVFRYSVLPLTPSSRPEPRSGGAERPLYFACPRPAKISP
jgi:hypothetical protein